MREPSARDLADTAAVAFALRHVNHDGLPGAPDGVRCPRCVSERALAELGQRASLVAAKDLEILRLVGWLERIYQQGRGPHVELARRALNGDSDA
jgi:hypothetical protein